MSNMKNIIIFLFLTLALDVVRANDLVLKENNLGKLKLSKDTLISIEKIKKLFPLYSVKHNIGSGDSPDFHVISISEKDGELLFEIFSYLEGDVSEKTQEYDIDLLVIRSPKIIDEYGIKIGDKLEKVFKVRGKNLNFGANHFDNSFGAGKIFYNFSVTPKKEHEMYGYSPAETVSKEYAIKDNSAITAISWPKPRW